MIGEEFKNDVNLKVKELMKNNMKLPFNQKVARNNADKEHLEFIYGRLINVHKENENVDYILRLKKIIDSYDR